MTCALVRVFSARTYFCLVPLEVSCSNLELRVVLAAVFTCERSSVSSACDLTARLSRLTARA